MTNVWITPLWTKFITNFLIFTCKNAMEIGCSLSLSFLKFLKFANTLISSEYCSRKLKCALCTMRVRFCYPALTFQMFGTSTSLTSWMPRLRVHMTVSGGPAMGRQGERSEKGLYQSLIQLYTAQSKCSYLQRGVSINQRSKPQIEKRAERALLLGRLLKRRNIMWI